MHQFLADGDVHEEDFIELKRLTNTGLLHWKRGWGCYLTTPGCSIADQESNLFQVRVKKSGEITIQTITHRAQHSGEVGNYPGIPYPDREQGVELFELAAKAARTSHPAQPRV